MSKWNELKRLAEAECISSELGSFENPQLCAAILELIAYAESLEGLYRRHKATEERQMIELRATVGDLSALVRRLVQTLTKAAPDNDLPAKAMDYLKRKGLQGSPLRDQGASK